MNNSYINSIAEEIAQIGGSAYYVGGCVRDELLGLESKDIDIEIHKIDEEQFLDIMKRLRIDVDLVGKQFGVYKAVIDGEEIDFSFPRTEEKHGHRHKDFNVEVDPFLTPEKATLRRDFTINALMRDVLSGDVLDFHNGVEDLIDGVIRHVGDKFSEDPLRVYRAAQFAARFEFTVAPETVQLCREIDASLVAPERVNMELTKALTKSEKPSTFFRVLKEVSPKQPFFTELNAPDFDERMRLVDSFKRDENYVAKVLMTVEPDNYIRITNETGINRFIQNHIHVDYDTLMYGDMVDALEIRHQTSNAVLEIAELKYGMIPERAEVIESNYQDATKQFIRGRDLIELGFPPGKHVKERLDEGRQMAFLKFTKSEILTHMERELKREITELLDDLDASLEL